MVVCVGLPYEFNLDLSMYPSFVSSYYDRVGPSRWARIVEPRHVIYLDGGRLCCSGEGCTVELLEKISGLWCYRGCREGLASSRLRERVEPLLASYRGLQVSAAPRSDWLLVASAVILSRRTSYAWNVRRWMKLITREGVSVEKIARLASTLPSPQPRLLSKIIARVSMVLEEADCSNPWAVRRSLLQVGGVGPKTADAILLFTGCTSGVAPADVHLQRFLSNILGIAARQPAKQLCLKAEGCAACPYSTSCMSGLLVAYFGPAAGLVQTLAYVYDTLGVRGWREKLEYMLERYYTSSGGTSPGR